MSDMTEEQMNIVVGEIARVALEVSVKTWDTIGNELDLSDEEMSRIYDYLQVKLNQENNDA